MHCTWKARFGVTAAFVGGFWLLGQTAAQADENSATGSLDSVTAIVTGAGGDSTGANGTSSPGTGTTGDTDAEANGGHGGDGGDAYARNTNSADGGDASHRGDNYSLVQAGNLCVIAKECENQNNVGHTGDGGDGGYAKQHATTIGGSGGDGGNGGHATATSEPDHAVIYKPNRSSYSTDGEGKEKGSNPWKCSRSHGPSEHQAKGRGVYWKGSCEHPSKRKAENREYSGKWS
jgi:hypothetical protein